MTNLLEESRNLLPGRGHANWVITEKTKYIGDHEDALMRAHKAAGEAMGRVFGSHAMGDGWRTFAEYNDVYFGVGGSWTPKPGVYTVGFRAEGNPLEEEGGAKLVNKILHEVFIPLEKTLAGYGKVLHARFRNNIVFVQVQIPEDRIESFMRSMTRIATNVAKRVKMVLGPAHESVAGAPGAFAVSDAEPPSLEAMKADLLDRCRNPRWEYPSWALPKVRLDEEPDELDEAKKVDDYPWHRSKKTGKVMGLQKIKIGRLGRVSYSQAKAHEEAGKMQHDWGFDREVGGHRGPHDVRTFQKCSICGRRRELDPKGRTVYR